MSKKAPEISDVLEVIGDLTQMVSDRFNGVEKRLDGVEKRLGNLEVQVYDLAETSKQHTAAISRLEQKVDQLYSVLDSHMKRIEEIIEDNAARDLQQQRMERWIFQIADKLDLKLSYDV